MSLIRQDSGGPVRGHRGINICWGTAIVHLMSLSPGALSLRGVMTVTTRESKETDSSHPAKKKIQVKVSGTSHRTVTGTRRQKWRSRDSAVSHQLHSASSRCLPPCTRQYGVTILNLSIPSIFHHIRLQNQTTHKLQTYTKNTEFHHCYVFRHVCAILRKSIHQI